MIREFIIEALRICFELTVIPLGVAALIGLVVAVIQAVTQVQEQTTVYVAKLVGVVGAVVLLRHSIEERFMHLMMLLEKLIASGGETITW